MRRSLTAAVVIGFLIASAAEAQSFEVASVRASRQGVGHDGDISIEPGKFVARNASLKRLIFEAWQLPYAQIRGGPAWLNTDEFEIEAKAEGPASAQQLRLMLRALLIDRFKLNVRTEKRETRVYVLTVAKGGPRFPGVKEDRTWEFRGDMNEFASRLAISLTIPLLEDPSTPSRAQGTPIPVINKTGIEDVHEIGLHIRPDQGADPFTIWQRALQEQLGLRLESQKAPVDFLIVEHAERLPSEN
jgi:uncharacterized protein (TIGR03435 family)